MAGAARDLAFIRRAFAVPRPEPSERSAPEGVSAVLLALYDSSRGPELLYTRRADSLRSHPGEISFPGGRVDPVDATPRDAALRETHEEVGIAPDEVRVLGHLDDFLTHRDVLVCSYVGEVVGPRTAGSHEAARPAPPTAPHSLAEVADVFTVPIETLLDPARYEGRAIAGMGRAGRVHYWRLDGRTMWGITGELTARFLKRVYGWTPPTPARLITDLSQFRPDAVD